MSERSSENAHWLIAGALTGLGIYLIVSGVRGCGKLIDPVTEQNVTAAMRASFVINTRADRVPDESQH